MRSQPSLAGAKERRIACITLREVRRTARPMKASHSSPLFIASGWMLRQNTMLEGGASSSSEHSITQPGGAGSNLSQRINLPRWGDHSRIQKDTRSGMHLSRGVMRTYTWSRLGNSIDAKADAGPQRNHLVGQRRRDVRSPSLETSRTAEISPCLYSLIEQDPCETLGQGLTVSPRGGIFPLLDPKSAGLWRPPEGS